MVMLKHGYARERSLQNDKNLFGLTNFLRVKSPGTSGFGKQALSRVHGQTPGTSGLQGKLVRTLKHRSENSESGINDSEDIQQQYINRQHQSYEDSESDSI